MSIDWIMILCAFVFMCSLPLILKLRDWLYRKQNLAVGKREDPIFYFGLIACLTLHSAITGSEFTAVMSSAPWTMVCVQLIKTYWYRR